MRCLIIAPSAVDLRVLLGVLKDQDVQALSTADLGAGAALARVPFDGIDCGIAVVPGTPVRSTAGLPATYVEIGIAVGRGLPMLVVAEPPELPSPALAGITTVSTPVHNVQALRLHLGLFLRSVAATPARPTPQQPVTTLGTVAATYRARLDTLRKAHPAERAMRFEQLVGDLLRATGADVVERPHKWS